MKVVLFDAAGRTIVGHGMIDQGVDQSGLAQRLFERVARESAVVTADVRRVVATGYGRERVDFANTTITEISCHAAGVRFLHPEARTVVDVGGQDSKLIRLDGQGRVRDFAMNDRCAAGTGRFLEVAAQRLELPLDAMGAIPSNGNAPAPITSACVVFAETEIIGLLAQGAAPDSIAAGVRFAIAQRVAALACRRADPPTFFTGGVARLPGMAEALRDALECPVSVARTPHLTGALGAAVLAARNGAFEHSGL